MNKKKMAACVDGVMTYIDISKTLADALGIEKPCAGHGRCGKCKIRASGELSPITGEERQLLSPDELNSGIRLACRTYAIGECDVELLAESTGIGVLVDSVSRSVEVSLDFSGCGVALDLGTTTIAARLYDERGRVLSIASIQNPQIKWGADVMSRIEAALSGERDNLASSVSDAISLIITELADKADIDVSSINEIVICGNTVMLSLLSGRSVEPLSHAPFKAEHLFGEYLSAKELGIDLGKYDMKVYLAPCISAFVGADVVCGAIATSLTNDKYSALVDIGTNGEMALWNGERIIACSTAAGPAFEGVGISMGMRGTIGAIDKVKVENGELICHVIGEGAPTGICGSGLIDAVACMLDTGVIDEVGFMESSPFTLLGGVSVTQRDMRMVQLAKSAILAGLNTLFKSEGVKYPEVYRLYVAGGFGNYMNKQSAVRIGLLPRELLPVVENVGNAALEGASALLLNRELRGAARELALKASVVDLATNADFSEFFTFGMSFE